MLEQGELINSGLMVFFVMSTSDLEMLLADWGGLVIRVSEYRQDFEHQALEQENRQKMKKFVTKKQLSRLTRLLKREEKKKAMPERVAIYLWYASFDGVHTAAVYKATPC